jgi:hypothetical protein
VCFPFLFLFGSDDMLYSYERTEDKILTLQQFTNKTGSVFNFPVWAWIVLWFLVAEQYTPLELEPNIGKVKGNTQPLLFESCLVL